ncbi:hypothetical protein I4U23_023065 [Adineta vaga]|nr:hypothetical protein I4U23_023065 [Adineta vaga]
MAERFLTHIGYVVNIRENIMNRLKDLHPRKKRFYPDEFTSWGVFILLMECIGTIYDLIMTIPIYILNTFFNLNPFSCASLCMGATSIAISVGIGLGVGLGVGLNCSKASNFLLNTTNITDTTTIESSTSYLDDL